ncbi:hypothetical protein GJ744_000725 [Endocarpon pusillum]|uniref:Uncharacterized protein n=1 Tax=Endocarpon pusillum TaxID=364733 RepID=A0A8H7AAZ0_9EURO|nr:hypothetical protein GJ744_000725 [Endocarpon pusillum]
MTVVPLPSKTVAWKYTIDRYLSSLSDTQRKTFSTPATPEECLDLIRQAQGRKKYDRFIVALRPLIEPLKRFEGSIDVLVQAQSGIASPIWGPLRMVVTVGLSANSYNIPLALC